MDILKPYLLLACTAFMIGFTGYWALTRILAPSETLAPAGVERAVSAPVPDLPLADAKQL